MTAFFAWRAIERFLALKFKERQLNHILDFIDKLMNLELVHADFERQDAPTPKITYFTKVSVFLKFQETKEKNIIERYKKSNFESLSKIVDEFILHPFTPKEVINNIIEAPCITNRPGGIDNNDEWIDVYIVDRPKDSYSEVQQQIRKTNLSMDDYRRYIKSIITQIAKWSKENRVEIHFDKKLLLKE